ncbi:MAG: hypothetical protein JSR49_08205, partial [Proteobacteria bacterium]|nr:hypothetical protein [Pseudomonadota bacterium]
MPNTHPSLSISCAFDAGAIEVVSLADPADVQLKIRADNAADFAQWFHFRLQGAAGVPLTLRFLNAGQCAYPQGWKSYRALASEDRRRWQRVATAFDGQVLTVRLTPATNSVWLAYFEPYSHERHLDLLGWAGASARVESRHLGATLDGRDLTLLRIASASAGTAPKKKVWVIARQHPGETMAEWFVEGLLERLLDESDPIARRLLEACEFHVVPNMNPDGAVRGNLRTNAAGANLNREWLAPRLERSPEVWHVRAAMESTGVDLCLDVHGDESLPYNFVAGSQGMPGWTPRLAALEAEFKTAWLAASPDFQTAHGYGEVAPGAANPTMATNWV